MQVTCMKIFQPLKIASTRVLVIRVPNDPQTKITGSAGLAPEAFRIFTKIQHDCWSHDSVTPTIFICSFHFLATQKKVSSSWVVPKSSGELLVHFRPKSAILEQNSIRVKISGSFKTFSSPGLQNTVQGNRGDLRKIHLTRQFIEASGRQGDFFSKKKSSCR